jgi:histidinol-phosphate aminotransferase
MAGARLGYLVSHPDVVAGCLVAALPYHLSAQTQVAGLLALSYTEETAARLDEVRRERARLAEGLSRLPVETWPSDANFILFRPKEDDDARSGPRSPLDGSWVWHALLARGVLVRDFSSNADLEGCLRVTVGRPDENDRFLGALSEVLGCP